MSGYVTGAMFIMSISARYLLRDPAGVKWPCARLLSAQYSAPAIHRDPATGGSSATGRPNSASETGGDGRANGKPNPRPRRFI